MVDRLRNGATRYVLTDEDRVLLRDTKIIEGEASVHDIIDHAMCIMQLTSMLLESRRIEDGRVVENELGEPVWADTREHVHTYSDHPICVSAVVTDYLINVNDSVNDAERERLRDLVPEIMGSCPTKLVVEGELKLEVRDETEDYLAAEDARSTVLNAVHDVYDLDEVVDAVRRAVAIQ